MYLDEQKADGLHQTAVLADDYSLTHKQSFLQGEQQMPGSLVVEENVQKHVLPMVPRGRHNGQDRGRPDNQNKAEGGAVCYYRKKKGHIMAEYRILEKKNNISSNVLVTLKSQSSAVEKPSGKRINTTHSSLQAMYLSENSTKVPIEILRDVGTTQSLVGTKPTLPIKGISLILGNDLAGSKVMPDLQLVSDPTATMGVDAVESSIFPVCAVTRATAKRAQQKADETSITVHIEGDADRATPSQTSQIATEDGITEPCPFMKRQHLIQEQQCDVELR